MKRSSLIRFRRQFKTTPWGMVTFNDPFGTRPVPTRDVSQSCDGTVFGTKAMLAFAEDWFVQGLQDERHTSLNDLVPAGGNAKGT